MLQFFWSNRKSRAAARIPILTYHSLNTPGTDYAGNDHVKLEADVEMLHELGYQVMPLTKLVALYDKGKLDKLSGKKVCALSFDDGVNHDYIDYLNPKRGLLKSFTTILAEAQQRHPRWGKLTATSFLIASAEARDVLDKTCIAGRGQWSDDWWNDAGQSGFLDFGNHSWDHNHQNVEIVAQRDQIKGNFVVIDTWEDAERQILDAEQYIVSKVGKFYNGLFAYPYGDMNDFLANEFFPRYADRFKAAFSTGGDYMTQDSERWRIPRFVAGQHWKNPKGLRKILCKPHRHTQE